ncbi:MULTISPECIES: GGDEF domain-containing protein [Psychrilyobacter]|nr:MULTISPECIES: GGDEF domain-containing protein [Psychrilyobacter]MCS5422049.1 GGDEF domain-containing protein [Psychrilyobacter sp. S5]NDI79002.1 GGDEF domain-containing protein [Psychrilyobacter piezotolerans]
MKLKVWKTLVINIILMIIFVSIVVMVSLKMNITEFDLNYFILPIFFAILFGSIITYLSMKRTRHLEERIKEKTKELKHYPSMDDMTNTYNRRMGLKMLKNHFSLSKRDKNSLSVCLIDLNGLKSVNHTFGHTKGDELIRDVAEMLRSSIRESDIISRMGGDEFLTILPECDIAGARKVMKRLREKIRIYNEDSQKSNSKSYSESISFGISESSYHDKKTVEYLLLEADNKMNIMKKKKRAISHYSEGSSDNVLIFKLWVIVL